MCTFKFNETDADLIKKIMEYQKAHGIFSSIGAIRKLCKNALEIEKIKH